MNLLVVSGANGGYYDYVHLARIIQIIRQKDEPLQYIAARLHGKTTRTWPFWATCTHLTKRRHNYTALLTAFICIQSSVDFLLGDFAV
jgi:hypothetical protein